MKNPFGILFNREGAAPSGVATFCRQIAKASDEHFLLIEPGLGVGDCTVGNRIGLAAEVFCRGRVMADFLWSNSKLQDVLARYKQIVLFPNVGEECYIAATQLAVRIQKVLGKEANVVGICHSFDLNQFEHLKRFSTSLSAVGYVSPLIHDKLVASKTHLSLFPVHYPIRKSFFDVTRKENQSSFLRLIYTGRLESKQKRVDRLVKLVEVLTRKNVEFSLTLIGDGPARQAIQEKLDCMEMKGRGGIRIVGAVPNDHISGFLSDADVQLLVSEFEGNPISILEGMAAGVCPVVMDMESGWESIQDAKTGYIVPQDDIESMAAVIKKLANDRGQVRRIGQAAAQSVRKFELEKCRDRLTQAMSELEARSLSSLESCLLVSPTELALRECINMVKLGGFRSIAIYGAGHLGLALVASFAEQIPAITVERWVDSSNLKIGLKMLNYEICHPKTLLDVELDAVIIASVDYDQEISNFIAALYTCGNCSVPPVLRFKHMYQKATESL